MSGTCPKCGTARRVLHREHITPRWQGGTEDPTNIQYICANCHEDKTYAESQASEYREMMRNTSSIEYRREQGRIGAAVSSVNMTLEQKQQKATHMRTFVKHMTRADDFTMDSLPTPRKSHDVR